LSFIIQWPLKFLFFSPFLDVLSSPPGRPGPATRGNLELFFCLS
jgi:hypothetical protein